MDEQMTEKRGRGRPRKEEEVTRRRKRGGGEMYGRRLAVAESKLDFDNFVYRWVNDTEARMYLLTKEDDWDVVTNDDNVKDDNGDLGNAVSTPVGTHPDGSAMRAYLCRKPRTFWEDDQSEKQSELDKQLAQMRVGNDRHGGSQSDYIPNAGIKIS